MTNEQIELKLIDIEARQQLLIDALLSVVEIVHPDHENFALFALIAGFTAKELETLNDLMRWANMRGDKLNKEDFIERFNKELPRRRDTLNAVVRSFRTDERYPHILDILEGKQSSKH